MKIAINSHRLFKTTSKDISDTIHRSMMDGQAIKNTLPKINNVSAQVGSPYVSKTKFSKNALEDFEKVNVENRVSEDIKSKLK